VKKVWLAAALLGLVTMASSVFADVQNIRLSGDVRVRGYFIQNGNASYDYAPNGASMGYITANRRDNSFIVQRTRITCEADLEDHVLVVITLTGQGQWGQPYDVYAPNAYSPYPGNRGWSIGITEAYVQFSEMFFTPATLKLGRQYLNYGRGLIISSYDQTYNFDAGRLVLDFYPFTVDLVGAKLSDGSLATPNPGHRGNDLLFVNARYEMKDSIIKNVEAYFGWAARASAGMMSPSYLPTASAASPWIIGLRTDLTPIKGLNVWLEGAYEGGQAPVGGAFDTSRDATLSAFIANAGLKYTFKDVKMEPSVNVEYTFASGGGSSSGNGNMFVPWFDDKDGHNGYLFQPKLSNIHIFNVGASIKPAKNVTASVQGYYYLKADRDSNAISNPWIDYGGLSSLSRFQTEAAEVGWEIDAILGYDYSKDARFQLVYAVFIPDRAFTAANSSNSEIGNNYPYGGYGFDRVVHGIRGEVNVRF